MERKTMANRIIIYVLILQISVLYNAQFINAQDNDDSYVQALRTVADCKIDPIEDEFHQFYDSTKLDCVNCEQNNTFQTVTEDGLECQCQPGYKKQGTALRPWDWTCVLCPNNQVASSDGWGCVECDTGLGPIERTCPDCVQSITVERLLNGSEVTTGTDPARKCAICSTDTTADIDGARCERCDQQLSYDTSGECDQCPGTLAGGVCFRAATDVVPAARTEVIFGELAVESALLANHLRAAHGMCANQTINQPTIRDTSEYSNLTACQLLGNMCVLLLYGGGSGVGVLPDACNLHLGLTGLDEEVTPTFPVHLPGVRGIEEWVSAMPWLFYKANDGEIITKDINIPTEYPKDSVLDFRAAMYHTNGSYGGWVSMGGEEFQLCQDSGNILDAALKFGNKYKKTCQIGVDQLFDDPEYSTYFYDLFLQYTDGSNQMLYGVPILVTNGQSANTGSAPAQWQLVHRYMRVDRESGRPIGTAEGSQPLAVRYAQSMKLVVTLQDEGEKTGKIYPPLLQITYSDVSASQYGTNSSVQVSFEVDYKMALGTTSRDISISIAVLSVLALVYSLFLTNTRTRRSGRLGIGIVDLMELFFYLCGTLADVFFAVILGFSVWWFAVYKGQAVFYLVPDSEMDNTVKAYIGAAFALKTLHFMRIFVMQVTTDIFFVDWERSPGTGAKTDRPALARSTANRRRQQQPGTPAADLEEPPVSAWRTYMVANEWNEIQTVRRVSPVQHMLLLIFFLYVIGFENWARYDTSMDIRYDPVTRSTEYSVVFRFAVMAVTYLVLAIVQRIWFTLVGSCFRSDAVMEFVDLCSVSNISVFLMTHDNFGHYIHGRSGHGMADVSLGAMFNNFAKEKLGLCGQRGLEPGTDQQTYEVAIPRNLRKAYNKVLMQVNSRAFGAAGAGQQREELNMEARLATYPILNRFLQNFIEHNHEGIDYIIRDKTFVEKVLDTEFIVNEADTGYFFSDYGHSFDKAILYGHEGTLLLFEILFFTAVDFIFQDFVIAAVLSYAIDVVIVVSRRALGKRNLEQKSMVDGRFLI